MTNGTELRRAAASMALTICVGLAGCNTRSHVSPTDGGGTVPTGCVSTRICADRLDCEDGERCNTALAEPVCQRIRCGTEGSACSETELCAEGLACLGGACSEGFDAVAACQSACERGTAGGCVTESCDTMCGDAQTQYDEARANAVTAGCLPEFDAFLSCAFAGDICDTERCMAEGSAYVECFSAFCMENPGSSACGS